MNWISTKEKKPEYGKRVLTFSKNGEVIAISRFGKNYGYGEIWYDDSDYFNPVEKTIDFWMELPKPPNKKNVRFGINYLHSHPDMERKLDIDKNHIIVDRKDWEEVVNLLQKINSFAGLVNKDNISKLWNI